MSIVQSLCIWYNFCSFVSGSGFVCYFLLYYFWFILSSLCIFFVVGLSYPVLCMYLPHFSYLLVLASTACCPCHILFLFIFLYLVFWFYVFDPCLPGFSIVFSPCSDWSQLGFQPCLFGLWFCTFAFWTAYLVFWISASVFGLCPLPATSLKVYFTPTLSLRLVLCPCSWHFGSVVQHIGFETQQWMWGSSTDCPL